ncbi:HAD family hydrolase [Streptomyces pluripotens]|uniref:HAD family hydrolase n=1 Tax=Streptomyces pluripotens TaxID=1355015 RepID=A0A221P085_9ACTN|nr:HAD-IB family hydrolase [Streptomyces pluripotens]ARP71428.1 HAD family hydrolase [Streptomyces pluripotens]ASN25679.1 HAD family hydrolase [Streptomyces pluripotens]
MTTDPVRAAFFDVDDTLITCKSMLAFLGFHWGREGRTPARLTAARAALDHQLRSGVPREQVNRAYYRLLRGSREADLEQSGRLWFAHENPRGLFHPPVREALRRHHRAGDLTILLSGSFTACLAPIGQAVAADFVVCTTPETADGLLTGELTDRPMIGRAKAEAAHRIMTAFALDPADCHAYADDASDLPVLTSVGHPVVVGSDPVLTSRATQHDWPRLPGPALNGLLPRAA